MSDWQPLSIEQLKSELSKIENQDVTICISSGAKKINLSSINQFTCTQVMCSDEIIFNSKEHSFFSLDDKQILSAKMKNEQQQEIYLKIKNHLQVNIAW